MKKLFVLGSLFAMLLCMSGCVPAPWPSSDPFGVTQRAQLRADVDTVKAQAERDARIKVAEAHASEVIGVAREQADAEIARSNAWARAVPFSIFIIVVGLAACLLINWQGRIYFERARRPLPLQQALHAVPPAVQRKAEQIGGSVELRGGQWCIIAVNGRVLRAKPVQRLTQNQ